MSCNRGNQRYGGSGLCTTCCHNTLAGVDGGEQLFGLREGKWFLLVFSVAMFGFTSVDQWIPRSVCAK